MKGNATAGILRDAMTRKNWEPLSWDTDFFGFPVARILPSTPAEELAPALADLRKEGIALAYWILQCPDGPREVAGRAQGGLLVDQKTTFQAPIDGVLDAIAAECEVSEFVGPDHLLLPLALAAGISSRFRVDPSMSRRQVDDLYTVWLERSVRKEIASAVYVTGTAAVPTGFVTVGVKNDRADIGLIAVDERARGTGCGKALVRRAARWGRDSGMRSLQVVTQGANTAACELYRRCGMAPESVSPVFHFWLQKEPPR